MVPAEVEVGLIRSEAELEAKADVQVVPSPDVEEQDAVVPQLQVVPRSSEPLPCNKEMRFTFNFNIGMLHFRNLRCQLIQ